MPANAAPSLDSHSEVAVTGRMGFEGGEPGVGPLRFIDPGSSRFTGASIAGLVVGAMGMFVFSVALRQWLRERRAIMALEAS